MNGNDLLDVDDLVEQIRQLIVQSAPDSEDVSAVVHCDKNVELDQIMSFSSLMMLGTIVALEDRFDITVTKQVILEIVGKKISLQGLAAMVHSRIQHRALLSSQNLQP